MITLFVLILLGSALSRGLRRAWYRPMWGGWYGYPMWRGGWFAPRPRPRPMGQMGPGPRGGFGGPHAGGGFGPGPRF